MSYAKNTSVPTDRSESEIKRVLQRYDVDEVAFMENREMFAVGFRVGALRVEIKVPMPPSDGRQGLREQIIRQRWRALLLVIKAKLKVTEIGISTLEQEFLPFVVTKCGKTIGEMLVPRLAEIAAGRPLLPMLPEKIA